VNGQKALSCLLADILGVKTPGGRDMDSTAPLSKLEMCFALPPVEERRQRLESFVLTIDNVMKMLAVYFRLDSGMPVVIMGETGCGKTFSVQYLATFLAMPFFKLDVHGGLSQADILHFMTREKGDRACFIAPIHPSSSSRGVKGHF
jgi:hypothetical protein